MAYLSVAYKALCGVFIDKKYLDAALPIAAKDATATKIIYGVLEKNFQAETVINSLCKVPDSGVGVLLKIGYYCLLYMDSLPDYAVVNGVVELSKKAGKGGRRRGKSVRRPSAVKRAWGSRGLPPCGHTCAPRAAKVRHRGGRPVPPQGRGSIGAIAWHVCDK